MDRGSIPIEDAGVTLFPDNPSRQQCRGGQLQSGLGAVSLAASHHSLMEVSWSGGLHVIQSVSCHTCLENRKETSRWCIFSGSWSQRAQRVWCCRPWRCYLSAVQHLSRFLVSCEPWNYEQRWKATLEEVVEYVLNQWRMDRSKLKRKHAEEDA